MAEEAQEITVDNSSQPLYVEIEPAATDEVADAATPQTPGDQTVTIDPAF